MQLVIDIPDEEYALCKKQWDTECLDTLMIAVKYGTPLPKGYGRLIDADKLRSMYSIKRANFNTVVGIQKWIDDAPTILEADTEKEVSE